MKKSSKLFGSIVGLALIVSACSAGTGDKSTDSKAALTKSAPEAGTVAEGALDGKRMIFASFGGDSQEAQMKILQGFEKDSGVDLRGDSPSDLAKIKAQVESERVTWDVAGIDGLLATANCDLMTKPDFDIIDTSQMLPGVEVGECGVPADITGNVLAYNKSKFSNSPKDWADFFDTKRFPGKRAISGTNPYVTLEAALLGDGVAPENLYPLDLDRAFKKLDTIRDELVYWTTGAQQQQMIESGRVEMGLFWHGRVYQTQKKGGGLTWDVAKENPIETITRFVVPKGAPDPAASMALINYWIGAEQSATMAELTSYPGPNKNAKPKLDDRAQNVLVTGPLFSGQVYIDEGYWATRLAKITDRYINWVNG